MSIGRAHAITLAGLSGEEIGVEAHTSNGLPFFRIVGLPDASLNEARDRVRAALESCHISFPRKRVTVGLNPAERPKAGSMFDVAIAIAILRAEGLVSADRGECFIGELGLDGRVHPIRGVLPAVAAAVRVGRLDVVVPAANESEASLIPQARVCAVGHLAEVITGLGGAAVTPPLPPAAELTGVLTPAQPEGDLADVIGQYEAKAALEVAAAGGHHLMLNGPPGVGKTMLAARLPGILPDLKPHEAITVTGVHSVAGTFDPAGGLIHRPPFEAPHHSATMAAIIGGGSGLPRPGAASRAHLGVLFLDECPEFAPRVLDSLRQPLESGELVLQRSYGVARYPARFQLILAANPCPCGKGSGKAMDCTCSALVRRRYASRLSGPLLDRIDIHVEVGGVDAGTVARAGRGEPSADVSARVRRARERQATRLADTPWRLNAHVPGAWLRTHSRAAAPALMTALERHLDYGRMSLRGVDRVLRIAWTLADLQDAGAPTRDHLAMAVALRSGGEHA